MNFYFVPIISFIVTCLLTWLFVRHPLVQDQPNERSLHKQPVPRIGGVAIILGTLTAWMLLSVSWMIVVPLLLLFALSLADDIYNLSASGRLLLHFVAALFALLGLMQTWWVLLLVLAVVWMINLYNFMDGSDGLAGGMALFGFATYGIAAWRAGDANLAIMNLAIVAAALAFLIFNFNPAKIFMGDAGSIPLGFLAAMLGIMGWKLSYWPAWFPLLVFSPFIVDASATLMRRAWRGEKLSQAHRSHYYQRLIQLGWGHKRTALFEYALMLLCCTSALWGMQQEQLLQWVILSCCCVLYIVLMSVIDYKWRVRHAHD